MNLGILCKDSTKVGRPIKIKQVLPYCSLGPGEYYDFGLFLDLILFSVWHITLTVCQGPSADILLLNQYFFSWPIGKV